MSVIDALFAREIFDSRGFPTVEVELVLESGARGRASVPSGASTGAGEAHELRDGDGRFGGKGVQQALAGLRDEIFSVLSGLEVSDQRLIDKTLIDLDGTDNKSRLGANALLAASLASAQAAANEAGVGLYQHLGGVSAHTLPVPLMNFINGGAHANNALDFQEFMLLPVGYGSFSEALEAGAELYHALRARLAQDGVSTALGDEGGFAPALDAPERALDLLMTAAGEAGVNLGKDAFLALDCAASELSASDSASASGSASGSAPSSSGAGKGKSGYQLAGKSCSAADLIDLLEKLVAGYPILSIEDPVAEDDAQGWQEATERLGSKVQLVGDDSLVTSAQRVLQAATGGLGNAVLVKPNQVGTLSETLDTLATARRVGFNTIISHRSGETEDTTIADLAVATNAGQIKTGAIARGERTAKYNRLLRIEESLGPAATWAGAAPFARWLAS